jgi:hypothetical protein
MCWFVQQPPLIVDQSCGPTDLILNIGLWQMQSNPWVKLSNEVKQGHYKWKTCKFSLQDILYYVTIKVATICNYVF